MISAWVKDGWVHASYRTTAGELQIRKLAEAQYTAFVSDEHVEDWRDKRAVLSCERDFPGFWKLRFNDYDARKAAVAGAAGVLLEGDVSPVRRFISDHKCVIDRPRRAYFDLEADARVPFDRAVQGEQRLLSWALVDEEGNSFHDVLRVEDDDDEVRLWVGLWKAMSAYDQLAAWGGDRYDFEVLKERCKYLARRRSREFAPMWEHRRRLLFIDHLECFKRHHMAPESGDEKTSHALGAVSQALLGEGKDVVPPELEHICRGRSMGASSWDLWAAGGPARDALVKYMVQDAALLPKIEAATGYLELQQTICAVTHTFASSHGLKPMSFVDASLLKLAHERKTHLPSKTPPTGLEKEAQGAYVFKCQIRGLARTVHVADFKSLYPTIARTWNVGHETKVVPPPPAETPGLALAANGVSFKTDRESMIATFFRTMMNLRDHWKKQMKAFPAGTPDWKQAERMSKAYKIACNSGYGVFGSPWFRLYDTAIVEAITLGGQLLNRATAAAAEERGWKLMFGDTDSVAIAGCSVEDFTAFVEWCNSELYPRLLDERGCRKEFRCIGLAYEKCFDILVAPQGKNGDPASKRYLGTYIHYGGTAARPFPKWGEPFDDKKHSKPEIRGLEYMRGDGCKLTRALQKECIYRILGGQTDPDDLEQWIRDKREAFFNGTVALEDIVITKSISKETLADYEGLNKNGVRKSPGPHVRVAKMMQLRGMDVGVGTRVAYVVVDGRVSPSEAIPADSYTGVFDRWFYWQDMIYPATLRVLAGAFPDRDWKRWLGKRPRTPLEGQLGLGL